MSDRDDDEDDGCIEVVVWPLKRGETLSDHDWFPFYGHRFLGSEFLAASIMTGRREDVGTAVILWAESFRQDPAGTLPADPLQLAALARMPSLEAWEAVAARVLSGWVPVVVEGEGRAFRRLGHPSLIMPVVEDMRRRKRGRASAREAAQTATRKSRVRAAMRTLGVSKALIEDDRIVAAVEAHLKGLDLFINPENVRAAMVDSLGFTGDVQRFPGAGPRAPRD